MIPYNCSFAVDNRPHCVWNLDLPNRNRAFLSRLDPGHFEYLAECHSQGLDGPNQTRAVIAICFTYCHALEAFFSLLFAGLQAPHCVPGWLQSYTLGDLRSLISKVENGRAILSRIRLADSS